MKGKKEEIKTMIRRDFNIRTGKEKKRIREENEKEEEEEKRRRNKVNGQKEKGMEII